MVWKIILFYFFPENQCQKKETPAGVWFSGKDSPSSARFWDPAASSSLTQGDAVGIKVTRRAGRFCDGRAAELQACCRCDGWRSKARRIYTYRKPDLRVVLLPDEGGYWECCATTGFLHRWLWSPHAVLVGRGLCLQWIKACSVMNSFLTRDGLTPSLKVIYSPGRHAVVERG